MDGDTGAAILSDPLGTRGLERNTLALGVHTITLLGTGSGPPNVDASPGTIGRRIEGGWGSTAVSHSTRPCSRMVRSH